MLVVLNHKWNNLAHRLILPVGEGAKNIRYTICCDRREARALSESVKRALIVVADLRVLILSHLRYARHPDEQCEDMVVAVPALAVLVGANLPLCGHRKQLFETEMALNDECSFVCAHFDLTLLIDALRLHNFPKLEAFPNIFPHHTIGFKRLLDHRFVSPHKFDEPTLAHRMTFEFTICKLLCLRRNHHFRRCHVAMDSFHDPV